MRSEMVRKFVSRPPSQRWLTYGWPAPRGVLGHGLARLLLRADEQHVAAALADAAGEVVRVLDQADRLLQVDDVDAAALGEDEAAHLGVPAARLVAEVDSGLQELAHGDGGHGGSSVQGTCSPTSAARDRLERRHRPAGASLPGEGSRTMGDPPGRPVIVPAERARSASPDAPLAVLTGPVARVGSPHTLRDGADAATRRSTARPGGSRGGRAGPSSPSRGFCRWPAGGRR